MDYDGSKLQPKHVAVSKLITTSVICDLFKTYTCDLLRPTGMSYLKIKKKKGCCVACYYLFSRWWPFILVFSSDFYIIVLAAEFRYVLT